ncbi:MAG TPA: hypothetical protein VN043_13805 [Rhodanobacter sp.]|nr:hypothetical protein [Rhodanobacter sp.]
MTGAITVLVVAGFGTGTCAMTTPLTRVIANAASNLASRRIHPAAVT